MSIRGEPLTIEQVVYPGSQRIMTLTLDRTISNGSELNLEFSSLPRGANGQTATMWGADLIAVGIPKDAELVDEMALAFDDTVTPTLTTPSTSESPGRDF